MSWQMRDRCILALPPLAHLPQWASKLSLSRVIIHHSHSQLQVTITRYKYSRQTQETNTRRYIVNKWSSALQWMHSAAFYSRVNAIVFTYVYPSLWQSMWLVHKISQCIDISYRSTLHRQHWLCWSRCIIEQVRMINYCVWPIDQVTNVSHWQHCNLSMRDEMNNEEQILPTAHNTMTQWWQSSILLLMKLGIVAVIIVNVLLTLLATC